MGSCFACINVNVNAIDQATANRVRAWARRNNASVKLTAYTRGWYEGTVTVHSHHMDPPVSKEKLAEIRALLGK